jgi:anion-transporting  ArsA/GET3 family ATPase
MEKVFELSQSRDFDLIVVDTPPSQHALDFLEAPRRLVEFLDSRVVQILLHPAFAAGRFGVRLFQRAARVLHLIERVSGVSFLEDISEFLLAFEGMSRVRGARARCRPARRTRRGVRAGRIAGEAIDAPCARHARAALCGGAAGGVW